MYNNIRTVVSSENVDLLLFYNRDNFLNIKNPIIIINDFSRLRTLNYNLLSNWKSKIIDLINRVGIDAGEIILFATLKEILNIYKSNEMIEYRFSNQCVIGMNNNNSIFPEGPREIIVRLDHPRYALAFYDEWERELLLTLFHEVGHLSGIKSEGMAEDFAIKKVNMIYNCL